MMKETVKKTRLELKVLAALMLCLAINWGNPSDATASHPVPLALKSTVASSSLRGASYLNPTGLEMIKVNAFSNNNGQTWSSFIPSPDFDIGVPAGWRRNVYAPFVDPVNGNIITPVLSLDVAVDPNDPEPLIGEKEYYLRYRVSTDGGSNYLFDDPMVQVGKTQANPFDGVVTGQNGYYIGDGSGDRIIRTKSGRIIVPAIASVVDSNGQLFNPGGGWTYTDAMMILGDWQPDNTIQWTSAKYIEGDPAQSTRGMIEPTITQMPDGRLLTVMRGSNEKLNPLEYIGPAYKWYSESSDDGDTWTTPQQWTYDDDSNFFSPSSVSSLIQHSSGRTYWVGIINPTNPQGNLPRYPLVIGEVDSQSLKLIKNSVIEIDTKQPTEPGVSLSHMWVVEDRVTKNIVITGNRFSEDYTSNTPVTYRVGLVGQTGAGLDIVTDNLVLYLDAGNAANGVGVQGSGNIWNNQSGTAINHDATLTGSADWQGTGTPADPFVMRFGENGMGYGSVANSDAVGSDLDLTVFTYEIWANILGSPWQPHASHPGEGYLMGHSSYVPEGNGTISYDPNGLHSGGGDFPGTVFPGSTDLEGTGMHHIVFARAGDGPTDSTWYLDGVLQATFHSDSAPTDPTNGPYDFSIGARKKWFTSYEMGADADIAQVRVYSAALTAAEVLQNYNAGLTQSTSAFDPADFNMNTHVDGDDLAKWEGDFGANRNSDADGDEYSTGNDFLIWQRSLTSPLSSSSAVPEPSTFGLLTLASFSFALLRKLKV